MHQDSPSSRISAFSQSTQLIKAMIFIQGYRSLSTIKTNDQDPIIHLGSQLYFLSLFDRVLANDQDFSFHQVFLLEIETNQNIFGKRLVDRFLSKFTKQMSSYFFCSIHLAATVYYRLYRPIKKGDLARQKVRMFFYRISTN
ncbi:hypothetical protein PHYBLDRAFT_173262 [Phycomyces blakesleeanus NRRL 1555(-)]|uniref:Uncharacterized protein n=1 Tax=Phycomyces blakesleeanus (strain ATCC 8743b / DSM 1359 / FGSC 10004 / NBRC 33097 / NRRL 1555) TaxID=763407 RepID=A0A167KJQ5_PHYB8|nr:hypothetical protein PHYBLDRAFT_173262 [Phycomyces blakesleeanus NRRL 1555(-)]OAD68255.1 hypothetical protein PHYBLDRAFT_173262 [Phycomyces blakesleeanus NRRL 1555(-)]|eukprot:XP_018286295.1 hypothetical protein PHYBLDRAFT_173262 [Phycomyces blakesleeanus NRRL 1555(-)]